MAISKTMYESHSRQVYRDKQRYESVHKEWLEQGARYREMVAQNIYSTKPPRKESKHE